MRRPKAVISEELWRAVVDRYVVPYRSLNVHLNPPTLIPHKDGEPLLHKNLPGFLKYASDRVPDINIDIYTHGLHLPRLNDFIPFLGRLPNRCRLLISFHFHNNDGTTNDYGPMTSYLRGVLAAGKPGNVEFIFASHLVNPMTRERLAEWKDSWQPFAADGRVTVHANTAINPWTGIIKDEHCVKFTGCPYERFDHLFFGATGNVIACCMDLEEEIKFGHVLRDDPAAVVGTAQAFYAAQWRREVNHGVCHDCFQLPPKPERIQVGRVGA